MLSLLGWRLQESQPHGRQAGDGVRGRDGVGDGVGDVDGYGTGALASLSRGSGLSLQVLVSEPLGTVGAQPAGP